MVEIKIEISNLRSVEDLARKISDPAPLYKAWANYVDALAVEAFDTQSAPLTGTPWAPLSPEYQRHKTGYARKQGKKKRQAKKAGKSYSPPKGNPVAGGTRILQWSGQLRDSVYAEVHGDGVRFGARRMVDSTSLLEIHQFGTSSIPARPIFPIDRQGQPYPKFVAGLKAIANDWMNPM